MNNAVSLSMANVHEITTSFVSQCLMNQQLTLEHAHVGHVAHLIIIFLKY